MRVLLADVVPVFQFEICLMKIASFNINGIKARTPALIDWLKESGPDVALLQEIKSIDEAFPKEIFEDLGYNIETHGQKSFNGVAILSKYPLRKSGADCQATKVMNKQDGLKPQFVPRVR